MQNRYLWVLLFFLLFVSGSNPSSSQTSTGHRLSGSFQPEFLLRGSGVYPLGQAITISTYNRSFSNKPFPPYLKVYKVRNPANLLIEQIKSSSWQVDDDNLKLISILKLKPRQYGDYHYQAELDLSLGLYFAQLGEGFTASTALILVTDLAMVAKHSEKESLFYTANWQTSEPRQAKLSFIKNGNVLFETQSNNKGIARFKFTENTLNLKNATIVAQAGESIAVSGSIWSYWPKRYYNDVRTYIHTDRPIYRPKHTVYFKGTILQGILQGENLDLVSDSKVTVIIYSSKREEVYRETLTTDTYGSFHGELKLGKEPDLGRYRISIDEGYGSTFFEVQAYQKPEYWIDVNVEEYALQGEKAIFTVKGEYLFGGALAGTELEYKLIEKPYRSFRHYSPYQTMIKQGNATFDANGELVLEHIPALENYDYALSLEVGVRDEARRQISSSALLPVYRSDLILKIDTERSSYELGDEVEVTVQAQDLKGRPVQIPFTLIPTRGYWQHKEERKGEGKNPFQGETDEMGKAVISFSPSEQGYYRLNLKAQDFKGREASVTTSLRISSDEPWYWHYENFTVATDKYEYEVGEVAQLTIESPIENAYVLITSEGKAIHNAEVVQILGNALTHEVLITEDVSPTGHIKVVMVADSQYYIQEVSFSVPARKNFLDVNVQSNKEIYAPNEEGILQVQVSDSNGQGVQAQIALALVDEGVFLLRPYRPNSLQKFFYGFEFNKVMTNYGNYFPFSKVWPLNCWDINNNGKKDTFEDMDNDGNWNLIDCHNWNNTLVTVEIPDAVTRSHNVKLPRIIRGSHLWTFALQNKTTKPLEYKINESLSQKGFEWLRVISYSGVVPAKTANKAGTDIVAFLAFCPDDPLEFFDDLTIEGSLPIKLEDSSGGFTEQKLNVELDCSLRFDYFMAANSALASSENGSASPIGPQLLQIDAVSSFVEANLRQDFADTLLWLPTLETDAQGHVSVPITFPDNLTEWRVIAKVISKDAKVGEQVVKTTTTLPIIARLATPRFMIHGDEAYLRVIGQSNLAETLESRLELTSKNIEILSGTPENTTIAAGERVTADYYVKATHTGEASLTAQALTTESSDAVKIDIPILPHGVANILSWTSNKDNQWSFGLPNDVDLASTKGTLYITPSFSAAVAPALSYLVNYPYGCTEQTMSRFLPSVLAVQAGEQANLPEDIAENLDDIVASGLKRLYNFQHSDGGWGFWKNDHSNPFITAYVVSGLLSAQEAGYNVGQRQLEQGLDFLDKFVNSEDIYESHRITDADARAYAFYTLARANRSINVDLATSSPLQERLWQILTPAKDKQESDLSPYGLALQVLALAKSDQKEAAKEALESLIAEVTESESVAYWGSRAQRYYWNDDRIEATAYALQALYTVDPEHYLVPKVVNWLLQERKGSRWRSTKDTAAVITAALLMENPNENILPQELLVKLNGQVVQEITLSAITQNHQVELTQFQVGENILEIDTSSNSPHISAQVKYFAEKELYKKETTYFDINRTYERLELTQDENEYYYKTKPLDETQVGDLVLVTVNITPKENYRYVLVNEPLPAGYRVVENEQSLKIKGIQNPSPWHWSHNREIFDERIDIYFTYLNNQVSFSYIIRAETPGQFSALPTQVWLMYEPDIRGLGTQNTLGVKY